MGEVSNIKQKIILMAMLLLQIGIILFYGTQKTGFHMDEYATYTLANGYCDIGLPVGYTDFQEYLHNALTIQENEVWDYKMVWKNQAADVHPPLYYAGIHAISSMFIGSDSKWIGISDNLLFFVINILLLYKLSKRLFRGFYPAFAVCFLYGLSAGAISNVMFIRMYEMFVCAVLLVLNWHVKYFDRKKIPWYAYIAVTVMTVLGILTHYYFLIFLCFLSIIYMLYQLFRHEIKNGIKYVICMGVSGMISYMIFPSMKHHIFSGYRGREAFANIKNGSDFWLRFKGAIKWCVDPLLGNVYLFLVILIMVAVIAIYMILKKKYRMSISASLPWIMVSVPMLAYVAIVSKIAPLTTDRYYYPVYTCFCIIIVGSIYFIFRQVKNKRLVNVLTYIAVIFFILSSHRTVGVQNLFKEAEAYGDIVAPYEDEDCVYVYSQGSWTIWGNISTVRKFRYIDFIVYDEQDKIYDLVKEKKDDFILMLPIEMDYEGATNSFNRNCDLLGTLPSHMIYSVTQ